MKRTSVEEYRRACPAKTAGMSDVQVEALVHDLESVSVEALMCELRRRGFGVRLVWP